MTKLRSRSLATHFRSLFTGGTLTGLGEGELLDRFISRRDEAAFEELVARHGPMVLAVCRRWLDDPHDLEDAFQAIFLILVRKAKALRNREALAPWLHGVSHRVARRAGAAIRRRRERESRAITEPSITTPTSTTMNPQDELARREVLALVDDEILRLPEKQRAAAVLCLVQGLSHEAAARALGWPLGTFKSRVAVARATLSRRLARRGLAPTAMAATGGLAPDIPGCIVPPELSRRTVDAALRLVADPAMKSGVMGASVTGVVHEVSRITIRACLGMVLSALAALGLAVWATSASRIVLPDTPRQVESFKATADAAARTPPKPDEAPPRRDLYGDTLPSGAVVRLGTIRYRQSSPIHRIAYSSDGKFVVTDGDDGLLRVWDAGDGRLIRQIDAGVGVIGDFALGTDPRTVMAVGTSFDFERTHSIIRHVARTDPATGARTSKTSWPTKDFQVTQALCPDRRLLAIAPHGGALHIIDTTTGTEVGQLNLGSQVERMTFSPDGRRLAVIRRRGDRPGSGSQLAVLDLDGKKELASLDVNWFQGSLAFSPDGSSIAINQTSALELWVFATGELSPFKRIVKDFKVLELWKIVPANRAVFSNDGGRVVGISVIGKISVCDVGTRRLVEDFGFRPGTMGATGGPVALSPDSRTLAAVGGSHVFHLWDLGTHRDRLDLDGAHSDQLNGLLVAADGKTLFTASDDGTIRLWDLTGGRQIRILKHPQGSDDGTESELVLMNRVVTMALSADGRQLAAATKFGGGLFAWDLEKPEAPPARSQESGSLHTARPLAVRFEEDDRSIVLLDERGDLHRWDRKNPRLQPLARPRYAAPEPPFAGSIEDYKQGAFLAGGKTLAVIGRFTGLQVVDVATGKERYCVERARLFTPSPDHRTIAIATDGKHTENRWVAETDLARTPMLMRMATDGIISLLDNETGKERLKIDVPGSEVRALAFAPDGKTLAATTAGKTDRIHLFDVATGKEVRTIESPPLRSSALTFTPDGTRLITGMADGSVLVW